MKNKFLQIKVAETFKERIRKAADHYGINISQFVIKAINEALEKLEI